MDGKCDWCGEEAKNNFILIKGVGKFVVCKECQDNYQEENYDKLLISVESGLHKKE